MVLRIFQHFILPCQEGESAGSHDTTRGYRLLKMPLPIAMHYYIACSYIHGQPADMAAD